MTALVTPLSGPSWARRQRRPLSATICGPSAAQIHDAIVLAWLFALDEPNDPRNERRLVRWIMRELRLGPASAKARLRGARRIESPSAAFSLLRSQLDTVQRERVLVGARHLASMGSAGGAFDRISAPVLASWLGLEAKPVPTPLPARGSRSRFASLRRVAAMAIALD